MPKQNNPRMKRRANQQLNRAPKKRKVAKKDSMTLQLSKNFEPELKAVDNFLGTVITPGTSSANHVLLLNCPVLGPDRHERIGRKIQIKKIHCRFSLHPVTPVPTSVPEDIVVMLIWDVEGTPLPGLPDLLRSIDNAGTPQSTVRNHQNLDNSKRFRILKRKLIPLRICGTATGALPCNGAAFQAEQDDLVWDWNLNVDLLTQFNAGVTGTVTDISSGCLFIAFFTDLAVGLPPSSIDINTRIRYYD